MFDSRELLVVTPGGGGWQEIFWEEKSVKLYHHEGSPLCLSLRLALITILYGINTFML